MNDPYVVLGVNRNATDEEIKKAYRELARKYHPDNYADNPLSDLAHEKMQEINEAYDAIMNSRRSGGNSGGSYSGSSHNAGGEFAHIRQLVFSGRLEEAQELLDGIPVARRTAEWYFLNGSVLYKRGWFEGAYSSFSTAHRMEPNNPEYREAFNRVSHQSGRQYSPYNSPSNMGGCVSCDPCTTLCVADCCCEMCGGDLIPCC